MFSSPLIRIEEAGSRMSITIMGHPGGSIRVSGDIETVLIAPYIRRGQPFVLGFSDGTLIEGLLDGSSGITLFQTLVEGAGIVMIGEQDVTLDWRVEWVTMAPSAGAVVADRRADFQPDMMSDEADPDAGPLPESFRFDAAHEHDNALAQMA